MLEAEEEATGWDEWSDGDKPRRDCTRAKEKDELDPSCTAALEEVGTIP